MNQALDRADRSTDVKTKVDSEGRYIRTSWNFCEKIVSDIAGVDLSNKKILVVDTVELILVLLTWGAKKANIVYIAPYKYKGSIAKQLGVRVVQQSLLEWESDMKFDIIIGNPPYQHPEKKEDKLWPRFVVASVKLLKDHGTISMITPCTWAWSNDGKIKKARASLIENGMNLTFFDNSCNHHFNIGQNVAWFISEKTGQYARKTKCILEDSTEVIVDFSKDRPMTAKMKIIQGIVDKIDSPSFEKFQFSQNNFPRSEVVDQATSTHTIPCIYTTANRGFISSPKESTGILKIGFNYSSTYFSSKSEDNNMPITDITFGELMMWMPVKDVSEALLLKSYMTSKVIRFFVEHYKAGSSGFKMAIRRNKIPRIDFSRTWTDQELYAHFGLTQEEIDYIEATVK